MTGCANPSTGAIEENTEYNVEYRVSAPGRRQTRWINAIGRARYDPDMVPIRFDGITIDVTARKQAELDLADALRRETLVNEIGHAIRRAQNPDAVLANSVEALGQALHADRCYYVTYDLEQGRGTLGPDWHRADLESIAGGYHFSDFNFNHDPAYLLGQTHVVEDSLALPGDAPPARLGLRSLVTRSPGSGQDDDRAGRRDGGNAAPLDGERNPAGGGGRVADAGRAGSGASAAA